MASEERPAKQRKLSHEPVQSEYVDSTTPANLASGTVSAENDDVAKSNGSHDSQSGDATDSQLPAPNEIAPLVDSSSATLGEPPLSKSQQKKLRKKAEWESKREERKVFRKEKLAAKKERKKIEKERQQDSSNGTSSQLVAEPALPIQKAVQVPITIIVDCDFDDLMHDGERTSLASQITRCYSDNSKSLFRVHLAISSFGGKLRHRFDTLLRSNYKSWRGFRAIDEDFVEVAAQAQQWMLAADKAAYTTSTGIVPTSKMGRFGGELVGAFAKYASLSSSEQEELRSQGETVYLSSEGDSDLTELKPYSTYIIGGIVDKNREKGVCHRRATERGVRTARLPIGEFMDMTSRKVLATNHVNEIMVRWLESGDWGDAFLKVIPKRKGGRLKGTGKAEQDSEGDGDAQVDEAEIDDCDQLEPGDQSPVATED